MCEPIAAALRGMVSVKPLRDSLATRRYSSICQLSVAGFDDIPTLRDLTPSLTTVRLPLEQMGRQAAELVLGAEEQEEPRLIDVRGEVLIRESTRPPA